ncbi:2TM domain-containing protein [Candidatus Synechococcus calcipolaris G9]|uniref:2TM domain-containing protein n=1 Tax=Candidatus Synechococcus calcipolaris G9 TaxID=1497997 RepID=A0ABT6F096_9SYNE|nr:2TM domain-containing protein [Candidatus Synechococcus calcipolaris]MDG2991286.1 2TM domain-containing protein [Candidatus Synechococcus calcipolaris G9]
MATDSNTNTYTTDDVQQILNRAIAQQSYASEFSWQDLLDIGAELGLTPTDLRQAEQDIQVEQALTLEREKFDRFRQRQLYGKGGRYSIIAAVLIGINSLTGFGVPWAIYISLILALKLGLSAWHIYQPKGEDYERAFHRWYRNHQVRGWLSSWTHRLLQRTLPQ